MCGRKTIAIPHSPRSCLNLGQNDSGSSKVNARISESTLDSLSILTGEVKIVLESRRAFVPTQRGHNCFLNFHLLCDKQFLEF